MDKQQKITAAITAVMHHIYEEEAALMQAALDGRAQTQYVSAAAAGFSPWSMSGRQAQMQMSNLMQMRTFQRGFRI
jgi:hypothetical protein